MSRKPDYNEAKALRGEIRKFIGLGRIVEECRRTVERLKGAEEEMKQSHKHIIKMLEEMDCKSDGNMGWEGRIVWLLSEMVRQEIVGENV